MSFLAPLFLSGALIIGLPILFHLIRRTTRETTPFSSLMFLMPTPPRVTRRSRLENLLLLLLRCLAVLLLAFGFARPFIQWQSAFDTPPAAAGSRRVILMDTSASMRRADLWTQAKNKAGEVVRGLNPEDQAAVLTFDRGTKPAVSFDQWKATPIGERVHLVEEQLQGAAPGWAGTGLGPALIAAAELLDTPGEPSAPMRGEIVVISDLQEGSRLDGLQGFAWPRDVKVTFLPVETARSANASIQWLAEAESSETTKAEIPVRLRITNSPEAARDQLRITPASAVKGTGTELYVPAGQSRTVPAPPVPPQGGRLNLSGDEVDFDNAVFVVPPKAEHVPLLFLGTDAPEDPAQLLYYIRRAFAPTPRQVVDIRVQPPEQPLASELLAQSRLLILGTGITESAVDAARQFSRSGKTTLFPMTTPESGEALSRLLGVAPLAVGEARVKDYALLAQIDFTHPVLSPFADPRFSDFTKVHFWKHRRLPLDAVANARVLARFDSGDPALVQAPLGKGSVMILTSTWRPADSQLALSSKFIPLLYSILEQSSPAPQQRAQHFIGDALPLSKEQAVTVHKPDGTNVTVEAGSSFTVTDLPGIYTVEPGGSRFAVNLSPEESRLAPLPVDRFTSLGVPIASTEPVPDPQASAAAQVQKRAAELESQQKLWRWLIVAAVTLLLIETVLAGRHPRAVPMNPSPAQTS